MNEHFFVYNDHLFRAGEAVISGDNRGLRFGDGLFETMRMNNGKILNRDFHFERLFYGMELLQFDIPQNFSQEFFIDSVNKLLLKNSISQNARIRLMIFRGEGNLFDTENNFPNYIIETYPLEEKIKLNEVGLKIDVFPDAKKGCDLFSNVKSNNYLPFVMAAKFAKRNQLDDAILLNTFNRICETAIANIFIIKGDHIYTPPLSEGCVAGVVRRFMLEKFPSKHFLLHQKNLLLEDLLHADEIFLTNSIHLVRWVKNLGDKVYSNERVKEIFQTVIQNL
jgi:branched-chain amino acid aminotransferase